MQLGAGFDVPEATDAINRRQINRIANLVKAHKLENKAIAVLGMSYKPDTPVVEESQGVMIANLLCQMGSKVLVNDPMALSNARELLESAIEVVSEIDQVLSKSDVLIITTPWPEYKNLTSDQLRNKVVIDCWRIFEQEALPHTKVIFPGRSSLSN
jgi:UDPglucose 6-dehydrogenase